MTIVGIANDKVATGMNNAQAFAEQAWGIIQSYINEYSYTTQTGGAYDSEIVLDPTLTLEPFNLLAPNIPDFPSTPIINDNFVMPDVPSRPDIDLPSRPALKDHVIPDFNSSVGVPQFTSTLPDVVLEPIQEADIKALFGFLVAGYQPQISEIKGILLDRIINGGTGLPADVEAEIWNRNLERDQQALQDGIDAAAAQWSKLNFSLPDGALADSLMHMNNEYVNKRLDTSRDVAIKQAEMEQVNVNTALSLVASIEAAFNSVIVQYVNAASNAMRVAAESSVLIFNSMVQYYNLLIEIYKAELAKYRELMNARLADVEIYKTTVEAVGKAIDADDSKIKIYVAEIQAEVTKLGVYETEIKGILAQVETIKAWIDIGRVRMDTYSAETRALSTRYAGELDGFRTTTQAWSTEQTAKVGEKDISLREQVAEMDVDIRVAQIQQNRWITQMTADVEKMKALTGVGSHVVAGALAAAHTSASVSEGYTEGESEVTYLS